jgi:hypothetical protein
VHAGSLALPTLIKMSALTPWRDEWRAGEGVIPVEVDLDAALRATVSTATL